MPNQIPSIGDIASIDVHLPDTIAAAKTGKTKLRKLLYGKIVSVNKAHEDATIVVDTPPSTIATRVDWVCLEWHARGQYWHVVQPEPVPEGAVEQATQDPPVLSAADWGKGKING